MGKLRVERSQPSQEYGYTWTVTFLTDIGDRPQITPAPALASGGAGVAGRHSNLTGLGADASSDTLAQGNGLSGHFELALFDRVLPGEAGLVNASATVKTSVDLRPFLHRGDEVRFAFANNSYPGGPSKRFRGAFFTRLGLRVGAHPHRDPQLP